MEMRETRAQRWARLDQEARERNDAAMRMSRETTDEERAAMARHNDEEQAAAAAFLNSSQRDR
jgi:hypothetical protein